MCNLIVIIHTFNFNKMNHVFFDSNVIELKILTEIHHLICIIQFTSNVTLCHKHDSIIKGTTFSNLETDTHFFQIERRC